MDRCGRVRHPRPAGGVDGQLPAAIHPDRRPQGHRSAGERSRRGAYPAHRGHRRRHRKRRRHHRRTHRPAARLQEGIRRGHAGDRQLRHGRGARRLGAQRHAPSKTDPTNVDATTCITRTMGRNRCWTSCYDASNAKGRRPLANPAGPKAAGAHPARRVPRREKGPSADASGRFRQRNMPRHAWRGGAGKRSGAQSRRASCFSFGPFGYAE